MTRVWTGRVAATPRARGHPTIDSIRVWLFILPFTTPFDRMLTSPPRHLPLTAVPKDLQNQEDPGQEAKAEPPHSPVDPHAHR